MAHPDVTPSLAGLSATSTSAVETTTTILDEKVEVAATLPYWLVNIPRDQWPSTCPEYLLNLPQKTIEVLSRRDEEYKRHSWEEAKKLVDSNQIHLFQRFPSEFRKYLEYTAKIKSTYGSVLKFVVSERLGWGEDDLKPTGARPFEHPNDLKIVYNDWPYAIDTDIVHLVVWTKFELEDDPATDDLTPQARREIDDWVQRTFRSKIPAENVIWFKNWKSLKSIHSIEHFHVMLRQPDMEVVKEITNGDVPFLRNF
ncbi:hypothetical protein AJ80_07812 [Polytolypa hystricis UAMH7299]|uniref:N-acetylglucosamine-induced protein 1 n=1 Tax=Polytolypa hystricis (strain UAMH7299) TaxID=1447883 RepID=A0A2B7XIT3_POLH7|nr:hypothetical protein AJ80_07812 [Polytolypa hystricis UAMH7299]